MDISGDQNVGPIDQTQFEGVGKGKGLSEKQEGIQDLASRVVNLTTGSKGSKVVFGGKLSHHSIEGKLEKAQAQVNSWIGNVKGNMPSAHVALADIRKLGK